ncbi:YlxQ family RNA-binding protein [Pullulanibacillus sp. KACC 23026]|uniref:YlxQ family RNA-binding protein n=1 Tax=Pullulanibacillus sp. KACC 23026 TaxID=3028315 RepID=UPI0023AEC4D1|nr:YlxQ family RNA-binding protein [Pullulanibacillus sp. KACC 23026]WEG11582.1 YlxQ family RNA-binding protein [Pullulanibacillus sp. KACC 23026]
MDQKRKQWISFLGLAARARKVITGEEMVIQAIRQNKAFLVLLSNDASARTKKTIADKCTYYKVPYKEVVDRATLGHAIGKAERVCVAITEKGFGDKLIAMID